MLALHPTFLEQEGRKLFAVLPYHEFLAIQEELQDFYDLKALRQAKQEERDAPTMNLEEVKEGWELS